MRPLESINSLSVRGSSLEDLANTISLSCIRCPWFSTSDKTMGGERRLQFCQKQFEMVEKKKKCFCSKKILFQQRKLTKTFFNEKRKHLSSIFCQVAAVWHHSGNTKGGSITVPLTSCLNWFGISCMATDNFCFYLQKRLIQNSQTGGQWYGDTSPFSIPCITSLKRFYFRMLLVKTTPQARHQFDSKTSQISN